jgi:hypothetical protein
MGISRRFAGFPVADRDRSFVLLQILLLAFTAGCQLPQPGLGNRLEAHVALVDQSGLMPENTLSNLNVRIALPEGWEPMTAQSTPLYVHQQWRSPSRMTGVGVAYVHMPLPMSAKALVWLARTQYSKITAREHKADAQVLGEWTDSLGREWFEGENDKYHIKGYVVTNGFDAWAVYSGYRLRGVPRRGEVNMAFRSMDSIVPIPLIKRVPADQAVVDPN